MSGFQLETERLILREWRDEDLDAIAIINADPLTMRHFQSPLTRAESADFIESCRAWQERHGFCLWPIVRKGDRRLLGLGGLKPLTVPWPEPTDIEIGWRIHRSHWGQGYAREAAEAALEHGLGLAPRVIAMTVEENERSWGLMRRLGMERAPALDFDHPAIPEGHRLRHHIVHVKKRRESA